MSEPPWIEDAERVVELTMRRVAANISTLVARLVRMGYRWGVPAHWNAMHDYRGGALRNEYAGTYEAPGAEVVEEIERAEHATGPLPLSVRGLFRWVGEVDLSGSLPTWNPSAFLFEGPEPWPAFGIFSCPLHFYGVGIVSGYIDETTNDIHPRYLEADGRYRMCLSADELMLAGYSGGCHMITVPETGMDPVVDSIIGRPPMQLIDYLRLDLFPSYR